MLQPWQNPGASLGVRCVLWSRNEGARGVHASPAPAPNTSPAVAAYLAPCVRDVDNDGDLDLLGLKAGNWCAAFACAALEASLLPGETRPHLYRAGVVEIVADARAKGLYHDVEDVRLGHWTPNPGDLLIWDRSDPSRPETEWWRHVNRLVSFVSGDLRAMITIGGNEGRRVVLSDRAPKALDSSRLLGFVSYYQTPEAVLVSDETRARDRALIAGFIAAHQRELATSLPRGYA